MNQKDKNLSLQFYDYMCNIVGSEEVVKTRREIFTELDIVQNNSCATFISSGSKAEGLDLKGSDYDLMHLLNFIPVYENLKYMQFYSNETPLVMVTNDTKAGFTKLKLVDKSCMDNYVISEWCETEGEETFISSKLFRETNVTDGMVIHGPCQSSPDGEYDNAKCLRCEEWITSAQKWIHRSRKAWPHYTLVTAAVQYGVLFVPIGCKNSANEDLQWRISFSVTEKLLIHSFSHTQLLCYALMKIILKDLIKPRHGDLLCSYFLKTIMFWLSEEINQSEWKPENMISCFVECIRRLIYCVEYKTCLHYFIPEYNLFEDRFTDKEHEELINTLRFIYESPLISVFKTFTCQNYRLESVDSHGMVLSASELSCYRHLDVVVDSESIYSASCHLVNVCLNKELCAYMLSVYARNFFQVSHFRNIVAGNKSFYQQYKRSLCVFKLSLRGESISMWLLLASLLYQYKHFKECLVIINYCSSRCNPDMIYLTFKNSLVEQTVFKNIKHRNGLLLAFKHLLIENVCFPHVCSLLPDELLPLITRDMLVFPPVVYSYLLQCLCCHHLKDYRGKQNALHNLELTIKEQYPQYSQYSPLITVKPIRILHASLDIVKELLR